MGSVGTVFVFRELWSRQEGGRMGELRAAFTGWEGGVCLRAESLQSDGHSAIPWTVDPQAPLSIGFSRREILEWVAMPSFRGSSQPRE